MGRTRSAWWVGVLGTALVLFGCGGGGGDGDEVDPLAALEGSWFGPSIFDRSYRLVLDGTGRITLVEEGGVSTGETGTIQHVAGTYYEGELTGNRPIRLFLDPSRQHAAFFSEFEIACLELGATTLPAGGFQVADIAPGTYSGTNLVIDAGVRLTGTFAASASIFADGSYAGSDASGLVYGSPAGTMLEPASGVLIGPYEDNASATAGLGIFDVLPSPDLQFLAVVAYPLQNTTLLNGQFIGAWSRD